MSLASFCLIFTRSRSSLSFAPQFPALCHFIYFSMYFLSFVSSQHRLLIATFFLLSPPPLGRLLSFFIFALSDRTTSNFRKMLHASGAFPVYFPRELSQHSNTIPPLETCSCVKCRSFVHKWTRGMTWTVAFCSFGFNQQVKKRKKSNEEKEPSSMAIFAFWWIVLSMGLGAHYELPRILEMIYDTSRHGLWISFYRFFYFFIIFFFFFSFVLLNEMDSHFMIRLCARREEQLSP